MINAVISADNIMVSLRDGHLRYYCNLLSDACLHACHVGIGNGTVSESGGTQIKVTLFKFTIGAHIAFTSDKNIFRVNALGSNEPQVCMILCKVGHPNIVAQHSETKYP